MKLFQNRHLLSEKICHQNNQYSFILTFWLENNCVKVLIIVRVPNGIAWYLFWPSKHQIFFCEKCPKVTLRLEKIVCNSIYDYQQIKWVRLIPILATKHELFYFCEKCPKVTLRLEKLFAIALMVISRSNGFDRYPFWPPNINFFFLRKMSESNLSARKFLFFLFFR